MNYPSSDKPLHKVYLKAEGMPLLRSKEVYSEEEIEVIKKFISNEMPKLTVIVRSKEDERHQTTL